MPMDFIDGIVANYMPETGSNQIIGTCARKNDGSQLKIGKDVCPWEEVPSLSQFDEASMWKIASKRKLKKYHKLK